MQVKSQINTRSEQPRPAAQKLGVSGGALRRKKQESCLGGDSKTSKIDKTHLCVTKESDAGETGTSAPGHTIGQS